MKKFNSRLFLGAAILATVLLNSCKEDDDSNEDPQGISFPTTTTFSSIENTEFRMWTNGAEVNTETLDFSDYIDEDVAADFMEEAYTGYNVNFTRDSIFLVQGASIESSAYITSNDSLFAVLMEEENGETTSINIFFGEGTPQSFKRTTSYVHQCDVDDNGDILICTYDQGTEWQTLESIFELEFSVFNSLDDIQLGDTLIILNQQAVFN